jgi:hypothetical protein
VRDPLIEQIKRDLRADGFEELPQLSRRGDRLGGMEQEQSAA